MNPLWPHQERGLSQLESLIMQGERDITIAAPTGAGKSRMMADATKFTRLGVGFFCVRRTHTENIRDALEQYGYTVGVRASGYETDKYWEERIQIGSIQTEAARQEKPGYMRPEFHIIQKDEAHLQNNPQADSVLDSHREDGAIILNWTATPLGIYRPGMKLIVAGMNSELRKTGAHLPCHVYAPSEIDMSHVRKVKIGEDFTSGQLKGIISQQVVGNIIEHYNRLNPEQKPCMVMGPDVKGALFIAQQFEDAGIPAASVDGSEVWYRGRRMKSTPENRAMVESDLKSGKLKVLCNRFVYREAVDIPELYHLILACPIGSILSYIQTVGRVLRNHSSLDHVIVQDHGGNWHRHGSPNEDRDWETYWQLNPSVMTQVRSEQHRDHNSGEDGVPEPICCPKCQAIRSGGISCWKCGEQAKRSMRPVIQKNGTLKEMPGVVNKPKRKAPDKPLLVREWERCVMRCKNSDRTLAQARGLFAYENKGMYPQKHWPFMPANRLDWSRKVKDIERGRLN